MSINHEDDNAPCFIDVGLGIKPEDSYIASYIASRRKRCGLSQKQLAELVGVSRNTIKNFETQKSSISTNDWLKIILIFNEHPRFKLTPR